MQYIPAEAVYAVFELKQLIDNRNPRLACDKAASVSSLRRTSAAIPSADGTVDPKPLHRILTGILALSNSYSGDFGRVLGEMMAQVNEGQQLDLGCALNDGSFTVKYQGGVVKSIQPSPASSSLGSSCSIYWRHFSRLAPFR